MDRRLADILAAVRADLEALYGPRLRGLFLYGSFVRGDQDAESDIDVLVVLDGMTRYGDEVDRTTPGVSALSIRFAISISLVFVAERKWLEGETPFLAKVRREALEFLAVGRGRQKR